MINPGIYKSTELSSDDYHADKGSYSRTSIMEFIESPYRYWANYLNPKAPTKKITPAMIFGSAFHTLILEPDLFYKHYVIEPEKVYLKDVGRDAYENYKLQVDNLEKTGKTILSPENMNLLNDMRDRLLNHSEAFDLISDGIYEQSYFWNDPHSGLMVKARPDIIHDNMYVDIKTIDTASIYAFQRSMIDGGYHIQGAMVQDARRELEGIDKIAVINIYVEKKYPYSIAVCIIDEAAIEEGHMKYKQALLDLKECNSKSLWQDYPIQTIYLPAWLK